MAEIRRSYCGLCHPRCGLLLEMENGRIVKVKGDPDHPISRGRICQGRQGGRTMAALDMGSGPG
jgi:thiosulfate reductase/polysulfide reductase chain A